MSRDISSSRSYVIVSIDLVDKIIVPVPNSLAILWESGYDFVQIKTFLL